MKIWLVGILLFQSLGVSPVFAQEQASDPTVTLSNDVGFLPMFGEKSKVYLKYAKWLKQVTRAHSVELQGLNNCAKALGYVPFICSDDLRMQFYAVTADGAFTGICRELEYVPGKSIRINSLKCAYYDTTGKPIDRSYFGSDSTFSLE